MGEYEPNNTGFTPRRVVGSHGKLYLEGPDGIFDIPGTTKESILESIHQNHGAIRLPVEQPNVIDTKGATS